MIYNKKYLFGLHSHSQEKAPKTNFLIPKVVRSVFCYVNSGTSGKVLGNLRMGTSGERNHLVIGGLELSSLRLFTPTSGGKREAGDSFNHQWPMTESIMPV